MKAFLVRLLLAALLLPSAARAAAPDIYCARDPFTGAAGLNFADSLPLPGAPEVADHRIYYIAPWEVETSVVPAPPAPGSPADLQDLAELKRWQAERTPAQCTAAWLQKDAGYEAFYGAVSPFARPTPEEVAKVFKRVRVDVGSVVYLLKEKYERPRPFLRDLNIIPCLEKEEGHAYPSGHSAAAWVFAHMLSDLVPAAAGTYNAYAAQAALNRVIGGVHHPTDIEAGRRLAGAIYAALKRDKDFRSDMDLLRRSLRR
ncbi:MAG: phosphatase PAP2 family protein [Elusimicrobiales bacterium]|nr:phosphatase PAP2 family protein [Elusimicrobiales bacterium]